MEHRGSMSTLLASLEDRALALIAADPSAPEIGGTENYAFDNCLDFAYKTVPRFDQLIRGKRVLDYGCGFGWQAVAMASRSGASQVLGLDIVTSHFEFGRALAEKHGCAGRVFFDNHVPKDFTPDIVVSLSAFEHFADPAADLRFMASVLPTGGVVILSFAEPWYSPNGSHINGFTRFPFTNIGFPWLNLFFSERAMLKLRSRYRSDPALRYQDISGGLNQMTLARFERIIRESGLIVDELRYHAVKRLPAVTRIPVVRELLTSAVSCLLRVP